MIASAFDDMRTNTGRFGDGLLAAVGRDPDEQTIEARAAAARFAHILQRLGAAK